MGAGGLGGPGGPRWEELVWRWCDQLIAGWERLSEAPKPYPAGSWGPVASVALVARDGRSWYGDF
ncbi:hypothetical protein ACSETL_34675 [Pseudomonas aeruginosa]